MEPAADNVKLPQLGARFTRSLPLTPLNYILYRVPNEVGVNTIGTCSENARLRLQHQAL